MLRAQAAQHYFQPSGAIADYIERNPARLRVQLDIVVQGQLIIEIKAVDQLLPIHDAQLLTDLRLSGHKVVLLMNFNTVVLKDGIRRLIL